MVSVISLAIPILLSAVIVFVASSILHMVLPLHRGDIKKVPNEDEFLEAMRRLNIPPGDYGAPHAGSPAAMKDPAFTERMKRGPLVLMTISPGTTAGMGRSLLMWFVYCIIVGVFAAYITGRALGPGEDYLQVFRFAGCTAFIGYSLALLQTSIWYRRSWVTTVKVMIDGLIYGLLTAGTFGWLWPR
jgi:hypothetical protein